jgi:guanylate kinase
MAPQLRRTGMLLCLVGPAGGGKTSHAEQLILDNPGTITFSVSATSRAPRVGEIDGVHYHFLSRAQFEQKLAAGDFFESEEVHGNLYGTLRQTITGALNAGLDLLLDIDIRGALNFKRHFPRESVIVFLVPPSADILRERLAARGSSSPEDLATRLNTAKSEYTALLSSVTEGPAIDYFVVNDDRQDAHQNLVAILKAERLRLVRLNSADLNGLCSI